MFRLFAGKEGIVYLRGVDMGRSPPHDCIACRGDSDQMTFARTDLEHISSAGALHGGFLVPVPPRCGKAASTQRIVADYAKHMVGIADPRRHDSGSVAFLRGPMRSAARRLRDRTNKQTLCCAA